MTYFLLVFLIKPTFSYYQNLTFKCFLHYSENKKSNEEMYQSAYMPLLIILLYMLCVFKPRKYLCIISSLCGQQIPFLACFFIYPKHLRVFTWRRARHGHHLPKTSKFFCHADVIPTVAINPMRRRRLLRQPARRIKRHRVPAKRKLTRMRWRRNKFLLLRRNNNERMSLFWWS